jgi:hypothetical protein
MTAPRGISMHRAAASLIATFALSAAFAAPAIAADIAVPMDEVRIVAFKQPVSTVYMGNPTIADITAIDAQHVFVLGKSFGKTNMIALGRDGRPIANDHVTVFNRRSGTVTVQKGDKQYSYACTAAQCEPAPVAGDSTDFSKSYHEAISTHSEALLKAADASK